MTWSERALFWIADALTALYAFAVGATLGSFVNVVAYRLPRDISLSRPASRCPACGTPIRLRDNLPVVGWLRLHGKCRDCGGEISVRYPLVEAAYGLLFATLLFADVAWQPGYGEFGRGSYRGVLLTLWSLNAEQISVYGWHAWLFSLLGIVALLEFDGQRLPKRITCLLLGVGFLAPFCLPQSRDVHFLGGRWPMQVPLTIVAAPEKSAAIGPWLVECIDGLAGLGCGCAIGLALAWGVQLKRADLRRDALILTASTLGLYFGWQTACGIWGVAAGPFLCCAMRRFDGPLQRWPVLVLVLSALASVWARPYLSEASWWPGLAGTPWTATLWASGAAVCTLACGCIVRTWPLLESPPKTIGWQPVLDRPVEAAASALEPIDAALAAPKTLPETASPSLDELHPPADSPS